MYKEKAEEFIPNATAWSDAPRYFSPNEIARVMGPTGLPSHPAVYRRHVFARLGPLRPSLQWHADWFHNLVVAFRTGAVMSPTHWPGSGSPKVPIPMPAHAVPGRLEVLAEILRLVLSPEYQDILPHFQNSGVLGSFGPNIVRAASRFPERYDLPMLRLINCLTDEQYVELLSDPDEKTQELAQLFLEPAGKREPAGNDLIVAKAQFERALREKAAWHSATNSKRFVRRSKYSANGTWPWKKSRGCARANSGLFADESWR